MAECRKPEILEADLASTVLDVAAWGTADILALPWLTPPPAYQVAEAGRLLHLLGATDDDGRITARGKAMAAIPCHPRIAGMLLAAGDSPSLAADIAALLEERGAVLQDGAGSCDLSGRIDRMRKARSRGGNGPWSRAIKAARARFDQHFGDNRITAVDRLHQRRIFSQHVKSCLYPLHADSHDPALFFQL